MKGVDELNQLLKWVFNALFERPGKLGDGYFPDIAIMMLFLGNLMNLEVLFYKRLFEKNFLRRKFEMDMILNLVVI